MADLDEFEFVQLGTDWQDEAEDITNNSYKQEIDHLELVWSEDIKEESKGDISLDSTSTTKMGEKGANKQKVIPSTINGEDEILKSRLKMDEDGFYYCDTPGWPYKCKNKGSVKTHMKKVKHKDRNYIPKVWAEDEKIINCAVKIDSDGKYVCGYNAECKYKGKSKPGLVRHIKVVHLNLVSYKCSQCSYVTKFSQSLKEHVSSLHEKVKHTCKFCSFTSTHKGSIYLHMRKTHGNQEKKKCCECEYETFSNDMLSCHVDGKHLKKVLYCDQCEFQTTWRGNLGIHIRSKHKKEEQEHESDQSFPA